METIVGYEPGVVIAERYEIKRFLGVGAMGMVFEVSDKQLNSELLALKILHPHLVVTERSLQRFKKETLLARKLLSPSIVRFYEFGKTKQDQFYVTMELVQGVCLADILEGGALEVDEALDIIRQIARGLGVAHKEGVIHRDIKPQNILVTADGIAKLTDFGTARMLVEESETLTRTGEAVGTPHYMAPEQFRGAKVDERADIYALGITLFELLTGQRPFKADTYLELAMAQLEQELPSVTDFDSSLPTYLNRVISKATSKDALRRFASVDEMIDALDVSRKDSSQGVIAQKLYNKAILTDARTTRKRLLRRTLRLMLYLTLLSLLVVHGVCRAVPSAMMRVAKVSLALEQKGSKFGIFLSYLAHFPSKQRDISTFEGIGMSSLEPRQRYGMIAKVRAGYDVSTPQFDGTTPLMYAYKMSEFRVAREILAQGVDVNAVDKKGRTAMSYLLQSSNSLGLVEDLKSYGADLSIVDSENKSTLHWAAQRLSFSILEMIVETEPELINIQTTKRYTPLHFLARTFVEELRKKNNSLYSNQQFKGIVLEVYKIARVLMENGANAELKDEDGLRPIDVVKEFSLQHEAVLEEFIDIISKKYN